MQQISLGVTICIPRPIASTSENQSPWTLQAIWYSGLLLVVAYIAPSARSAVALTRLSSHPAGLSGIRETLGARHKERVWRPSRLQLIIWQAPICLLNSSLVFYVVGLVFVVASSVSLVLVKQDIGHGQSTGTTIITSLSPRLLSCLH